MSRIEGSAHSQDPRAREGTRQRIIEAALATLTNEGFSGTSVRAVARNGGFNSALIFYYFGTLNGLLLAALDHSSSIRLERYRAAVDSADSLEDLSRAALRMYREDLAGGHITVFSELVGASLSHPDLGPEIVARAEPWLDFVRETLDKVIAGTPYEGLFPTGDIAYALVAFYLGVNLLTHLDQDNSRTEAIFLLAERLAPMVSVALTGPAETERPEKERGA